MSVNHDVSSATSNNVNSEYIIDQSAGYHGIKINEKFWTRQDKKCISFRNSELYYNMRLLYEKYVYEANRGLLLTKFIKILQNAFIFFKNI